MHRQLLVYISQNDPECFVLTPPHQAHQAHVDFFWSASDDRLTLVPRERAKEILEQAEHLDCSVASIDECRPYCHAA